MYIEDIEIKECPYCGGTEFGEGYQRGYAKLVRNTLDINGVNLYHIVCINCGSIVHSYVKDPEKFKE